MFVAEAHSFTQQARLAITLAWVAGYTNILSILTCGHVTSHVSGTTSDLGREIAEGAWPVAGFALFLLATFVFGAALSGFCTELGRRRGWESIYVLPMTLQALLLAVFALGVELHETAAGGGRTIESGSALFWMTGFASMAMGLQNATITRISSGVVRTTHVTGVLTDLGLELVHFLWHVHDERGRERTRELIEHVSARRLALLASIIGSFALGAGLGTLAFETFPRPSMVPPVLFLLWIIYQDVRRPIAEIEPSDLVPEALGLPAGIAVFHLRLDPRRPGKIQRLPNLSLWIEQLTPETRVAILDLTEVTAIDSNSAFELRDLQRRSREARRRRHILLAGITPEQYTQLRAVLHTENDDDALRGICPDLDLAVARGLNLLHEG